MVSIFLLNFSGTAKKVDPAYSNSKCTLFQIEQVLFYLVETEKRYGVLFQVCGVSKKAGSN